ncbi:MAG: hypothetical protein WDO15_22890 [Bacteroidota bacterium]
MKTLVSVFAILIFATSCDFYYVEPVPVIPYDPRDQFTGSYGVHEYSSTYDEYWDYNLQIYKNQFDITIDNFYNTGLRVNAHVNGNALYIPWQIVDGYELQGDGSVQGGSIIIDYKIRDTYTANSAWDFCSASGSLY